MIGFSGRPSNRTVVFSGFEENVDRIQNNTHLRRHKIQELKQCPFSEFRINGRAKVIDALNSDQTKRQLRENAWFADSLKSRLMYICHVSGTPYNSEQPNQEVKSDRSSGPVANFCLLFLEAKRLIT